MEWFPFDMLALDHPYKQCNVCDVPTDKQVQTCVGHCPVHTRCGGVQETKGCYRRVARELKGVMRELKGSCARVEGELCES